VSIERRMEANSRTPSHKPRKAAEEEQIHIHLTPKGKTVKTTQDDTTKTSAKVKVKLVKKWLQDGKGTVEVSG